MFRALLPLVLAAAAPDAPPRAEAVHDAADAPWVAFDLTPAGQIRFEAELNGHAIAAILDTGVSHSVLARASAAFDPARTRAGHSAAAVGGGIAVVWMRAGRIGFGGIVRHGEELAVADLPSAVTGADIDLLIGRDLLAGRAIDIDYPARRFRLVASGRLPFAGDAAPLAVSARGLYESAVTLGGRRIAPVIIDTGDGAALTLAEPFWRASGVAAPVTTAVTYGAAGPETTGLAIAPDASLGEAETGPVEVRIEGVDGLSRRIGVAGRIGAGLLRRYRVLLDPDAGQMVLARPPAVAEAEPRRSTSGLLLAQAGDRLRVLHVMRGGPAAAAGWRAGEEVCGVDGERVGPRYAAGPLAGWPAGAPGRTVSLDLCDGVRRRLTLQRFY